MPSPFDALQAGAFSIVTATMAQDASWSPSAGGEAITGKVLYQDPSTKMAIGKTEYTPKVPTAEFYAAVFPGLKEAAKATSSEHLVIEGVSYYVVDVEAMDDGKTHRATLDRSKA